MVESIAPATVSTAQVAVRRAAWIVLVYVLLALALFHETAWSMISTWYRSETFAHGFLIVPITLWLVWDRRAVIGKIQPRANPGVLLLTLPVGFAWLVASLVNVLVIQQLALVALLIIGIWAILGNAITRVLMFSLGFLFLAVPMGEGLVPPMMEFTAMSTVWLINLTGIPVYREGMYFSLPSGQWSVVEACSGVRYLIASFTLGLLYAYLTYQSMRKRVLFVLAAILVPIVANTVRAYMIVMLGHLSNMTIATGVDHLIYGWVFFGLVMILLFWLGSFWREDLPDSADHREPPEAVGPGAPAHSMLGMLAAIAMLAIWPLFATVIEKSPVRLSDVGLAAPAAAEKWQQQQQLAWDWHPINPGADWKVAQLYRSPGGQLVALYLLQYVQQRQGEELIGSGSKFVAYQKVWRITSQAQPEVTMADKQVQVDRVDLSGAGQTLVAWSWYRIGDRYTANRYQAKFLEATAKLSFGRRDAARIVIATQVTESEDATEVLQAFLNDHMSAIEASLDATVAKVSP